MQKSVGDMQVAQRKCPGCSGTFCTPACRPAWKTQPHPVPGGTGRIIQAESLHGGRGVLGNRGSSKLVLEERWEDIQACVCGGGGGGLRGVVMCVFIAFVFKCNFCSYLFYLLTFACSLCLFCIFKVLEVVAQNNDLGTFNEKFPCTCFFSCLYL